MRASVLQSMHTTADANPPFSLTPSDLAGLGASCVRSGAATGPWPGITDDSRTVELGGLFVGRDESGDVCGFAGDAVSRGAAAVLVSESIDVSGLPPAVGVYRVPVVGQDIAGEVADAGYGSPQQKLCIVGVTGTNGKTTVAMLTQHLLRASGRKCGLLGTVWVDVGDGSPESATLTTPGAIELRRLLAAMVQNGCEAVVMEVSSHALDQGRTAGIHFDAAVFTNLTQDHLDYHGTMDAYAGAKAKLFTQLKPGGWAVLNADDPASEQMKEAMASDRVLWTRVNATDDTGASDAMSPPCNVTASRLGAGFTRARFDGPWGSAEAELPMVGAHNLSNALQAAAAAHALAPQTARGLRERLGAIPPVPGRLEPVRRDDGQGPTVLVDYAHTPDAIERAAAAVRDVTTGRLIVVYGCGGDRDRAKRPLMTAAALRHADHAVLTSDNPRSEDPDRILDDASADLTGGDHKRLVRQVDRAAAIRQAIGGADPNDCVLIAGKGHEDYQVVADPPGVFGGATTRLHFDDREQARAALDAWKPRAVAC